MSGAIVKFIDAKRINSSVWDLIFEVTLVDCSGGAGNFRYQYYKQTQDGRRELVERFSHSWTPSDGRKFIFIEPEALGIDTVFVRMHVIDKVKNNCTVPTVNTVWSGAEIARYSAFLSSDSLIRVAPNNRDVSSKSFLAIVEVVASLAYSYAVIKDSDGSLPDMLTGIVKQFDLIEKKLSQLLSSLQEIIDLLKSLPKVLQGIVQEEQLKEGLARARSISQNLNDLFKLGLKETDYPKVEFELRELQREINVAVGLDQSYDRIIASAPLYALWLSSSVVLEKSKKKSNPDTYNIDTPFKKSIADFYALTIADFFDRLDKADRTFATEFVPNSPPQGLPLAPTGKYFTVIARPFHPPETVLGLPPSPARPNFKIGDFHLYPASNAQDAHGEIGFARQVRPSEIDWIDYVEIPNIGMPPVKKPFLNVSAISCIELRESVLSGPVCAYRAGDALFYRFGERPGPEKGDAFYKLTTPPLSGDEAAGKRQAQKFYEHASEFHAFKLAFVGILNLRGPIAAVFNEPPNVWTE
jgi:hypothetical protein